MKHRQPRLFEVEERAAQLTKNDKLPMHNYITK